jgi:hypothetical protein
MSVIWTQVTIIQDWGEKYLRELTDCSGGGDKELVHDRWQLGGMKWVQCLAHPGISHIQPGQSSGWVSQRVYWTAGKAWSGCRRASAGQHKSQCTGQPTGTGDISIGTSVSSWSNFQTSKKKSGFWSYLNPFLFLIDQTIHLANPLGKDWLSSKNHKREKCHGACQQRE